MSLWTTSYLSYALHRAMYSVKGATLQLDLEIWFEALHGSADTTAAVVHLLSIIQQGVGWVLDLSNLGHSGMLHHIIHFQTSLHLSFLPIR